MRGPPGGFDHDQAAVDLGAPVHPRGIFLADEAALGEADAVQFGGVAFEPEDVAKLGAAFADAEAQAVLEPARRGFARRPKPAPAKRGEARVIGAIGRPVDREAVVALDARSGGAGGRATGA